MTADGAAQLLRLRHGGVGTHLKGTNLRNHLEQTNQPHPHGKIGLLILEGRSIQFCLQQRGNGYANMVMGTLIW